MTFLTSSAGHARSSPLNWCRGKNPSMAAEELQLVGWGDARFRSRVRGRVNFAGIRLRLEAMHRTQLPRLTLVRATSARRNYSIRKVFWGDVKLQTFRRQKAGVATAAGQRLRGALSRQYGQMHERVSVRFTSLF